MDTSEGWPSGRKEITKKEDLVMISLTSQRELVNCMGKNCIRTTIVSNLWGKKRIKTKATVLLDNRM